MTQGDAQTLGIEVWRGGVNTWETDEMGHLNVRFYVTRAMEGLVGLAAAMGMPQAYAPQAAATLVLREHHIRFLREARPGAQLHMRAAVIAIDEAEAQVVQVLYHSSSGEPAATFVSRIGHVTARDGRPFPWARQTRAQAAPLMAPAPSYAAPRGLDLLPFKSQASIERARALGLKTIAQGAVGAQDCDPFGRMRAEQFLGRVADGVPQLMSQVRSVVAAHAAAPPPRVGGAVLEYRLVYFDWPRAGDRLEVRSGLVGADHRTQRIVHWILDPNSGKPWGTSMAIAGTLDLDARKLLPISPAAQKKLSAFAIAGLSL